jgi:serine/threonine-protein kinase
MTPERLQQIQEIYLSARDCDPGTRPAFLDNNCGGDEELRREVDSLLAQNADDVMGRPAMHVVAELLGSGRFSPGVQIGAYRIEAALGQGGMGKVYRALDTKLNRPVAIKFLSENAADPAARRRFQREAQMASALNHPHIVTVHDVGEFEDRQYIVTEFIDGGTFSDWAKREKRTWQQVLELLVGVADGLAAAHHAGILHRDIKPANILVTRSGYAKLADFGLAKLAEGTPAGATETLTDKHTLVGTIAYMSPEQAAGIPLDARSDIFSFGTVLYEMLAGRRPFTGATDLEVLQQVRDGVPPPMDETIPTALSGVVEKALEKDPAERYQSMRDLVVDLRRLSRPRAALPSVPLKKSRWAWAAAAARRSTVAWLAAGVLAIVAVIGWMILWRATSPPNRPLVRLDIDLGPEVALPRQGTIGGHNVVLSPDGARLVYVSGIESSEGTSRGNPLRLYTRRLDQSKASELPGTDGGHHPFFSPDGQWIGFAVLGGKLSKISVEGGAVVPLADLRGTNFGGASWGADDNIIVGGGMGGLLRVPANGGALTTILEVASGDVAYLYPQILPGGKAVLFENRTSDRNSNSIEVFTFAGRQRKTVFRGGGNPHYLPSGHLIYTNKATLFAIPFDLNRLETRGKAVQILDDLAYWPPNGHVDLDVAQNGAVIYLPGGAAGARQQQTIQWVDTTGKREPLLAQPGDYSYPGISPDGKHIAFLIAAQNIGVYDLDRASLTRLTSEGLNAQQVWSPDGKYVVFSEPGKGIYWIRADGASEPQPLTASKIMQLPMSFIGKRIAYVEAFSRNAQIWTLPLEVQDGQLKPGKPEQFLKDQFNDGAPAFSPNGHWLAYISDKSGKLEWYVRAFPPLASGQGDRVQISNGGVSAARLWWSQKRPELIYQAGDRLMAVSYSVRGGLFFAEKPQVWIDKLGGTDWALAPDGRRVAVVTPVTPTETPKPDHEVVLLLNFFDELRRRVPVK